MPHFVAIRLFREMMSSRIDYQRIEADTIDKAEAKVIADERKSNFSNSDNYGLREIRLFQVENERIVDIWEMAADWEEAEEAKHEAKRAKALKLLKDAGA